MFRFKKELIVAISCLLLGIIVTFAVYVVPFLFPGRSETVLDEWESGTEKMRIRVTSFAEKNSFVPGAYHVFEVVGRSGEKREIMTFRHDDQSLVDKSGVVVVSEEVSYVYTGWKFAVTTDNGESWSVWDASKDLSAWKCCNYGLIKAVEINRQGLGKMTLDVISADKKEFPHLYTADFGKTWHKDSSP